jgi:hypothetical protein
MGMRMTVSFKGTDGIRGKNGGNLTGRKISTAWGTTGTAKTARARAMHQKVRWNSFGHRLTGLIL